jgi:hypothetical protein
LPLEELAKEWLDLSRNKEVVRGTVVMLGSLCHMQRAGTVGYVEDFVEAARMISLAHGGKVEVLPLPLMYYSGADCPLAIRASAEVNNWAKAVFKDGDWFLTSSFGLASTIVSETAASQKQMDYVTVMKLPASLEANAKKVVFRSESWSLLPAIIKPIPPNLEKEVVCAILTELRGKLALDLCPEPTFERGFRRPKSAKNRVEYVVVGSSNASKTAKGLSLQGISNTVVYSDGWRATSASVISLQAKVKELMATYASNAVVLQLLDNSIFFGKTEEGAMMPVLKGPDGKYHLQGDLELPTKERQFEILNMLKPVLDMLKEQQIIIITPMPRYVANGCCDERGHVSNRFQRGFKEEIVAKLADVKMNIKNFLFINHYRNVTALDPTVDMKSLAEEDIWGEDPIHPKESFYEVLAKSVAVVADLAKRKWPAEEAAEAKPASRQGPGGGHNVMQNKATCTLVSRNYDLSLKRIVSRDFVTLFFISLYRFEGCNMAGSGLLFILMTFSCLNFKKLLRSFRVSFPEIVTVQRIFCPPEEFRPWTANTRLPRDKK